MANIRLKRSSVAAKVPLVSDLDLGEMAINTNDGKVFIKKDDGTASIVEVGGGAFEHYNQEATPTASSYGATWYVPSTSKTYKWVNDGTSDLWIDISGVSTSTAVYNKIQYTATGGETSYSTTYTVGFIDIFIDGNKLIEGVDFTATDGNTINFTSALIAGERVTFQVWTITDLGASDPTSIILDTTNFNGNLSAADSNVQLALDTLDDMSTGYNYVIKSANYTAVNEDGVLADTTGSAFTVTLPATPNDGDKVSITDLKSNFSTNNLIVARNGENIMGLAQDMTISTDNVSIELLYVAANNDWRMI